MKDVQVEEVKKLCLFLSEGRGGEGYISQFAYLGLVSIKALRNEERNIFEFLRSFGQHWRMMKLFLII